MYTEQSLLIVSTASTAFWQDISSQYVYLVYSLRLGVCTREASALDGVRFGGEALKKLPPTGFPETT